MTAHTRRIRGSTPAASASPGAGPVAGTTAPDRARKQAADPASPPPAGARHRLGTALRAVGVFADTAFRVVVLGADGVKEPGETDAATGRR